MTHCEQKTNGGHIGALAVIARRYVLGSQRMRIVCLFTDRLVFAESTKANESDRYMSSTPSGSTPLVLPMVVILDW